MGKKQELNTQQVIDRLGARYSSPTYGFITQVRNGTGYSSSTTADAMAMSLWPSRGLHINGFEVKVSRNDWLGELKNPEKAEPIAKFCHYWYLVVGNEDIVQDGELPSTWGLIVPSGKGLKIKVEAKFNNGAEQMDLLMIAGIFRNIAEQCTPNELIKEKLDERYESGKDWAKYSSSKLEKDVAELHNMIYDFEKASGVKIGTWEKNKDIGQAVKLVLAGRDKQGKKRLKRVLERAKKLVEYLEGEEVGEYEC